MVQGKEFGNFESWTERAVLFFVFLFFSVLFFLFFPVPFLLLLSLSCFPSPLFVSLPIFCSLRLRPQFELRYDIVRLFVAAISPFSNSLTARSRHAQRNKQYQFNLSALIQRKVFLSRAMLRRNVVFHYQVPSV